MTPKSMESHKHPKPAENVLSQVLSLAVIMYGCVTWTLWKEEEKQAECSRNVAVALTKRQIERHITNERILEELSTIQILLQEINRRKLKYVGHAVRNPKTYLMASIFQERRYPSKMYMDNITAICGLTAAETEMTCL